MGKPCRALLGASRPTPHGVFTKEELLRTVWGFRSMGSTHPLGLRTRAMRIATGVSVRRR